MVALIFIATIVIFFAGTKSEKPAVRHPDRAPAVTAPMPNQPVNGEPPWGVAVAVKDADGEGPGVEIDAAVESVRLVVEPHHGLRVKG
jgi:hypothetical protein